MFRIMREKLGERHGGIWRERERGGGEIERGRGEIGTETKRLHGDMMMQPNNVSFSVFSNLATLFPTYNQYITCRAFRYFLFSRGLRGVLLYFMDPGSNRICKLADNYIYRLIPAVS